MALQLRIGSSPLSYHSSHKVLAKFYRLVATINQICHIYPCTFQYIHTLITFVWQKILLPHCPSFDLLQANELRVPTSTSDHRANLMESSESFCCQIRPEHFFQKHRVVAALKSADRSAVCQAILLNSTHSCTALLRTI